MPGIAATSKRIKKDKKTIQTKKQQQNADNSVEEGEEGMLTEGEMSSAHDESDLNDKPPVMKLLDKYDKYVEYIEITIEKPG